MAGTRDKKDLTPEQLREIKGALDYLSSRVEGVAGEMETRQIPQITVKRFKTLIRAKKLFIGSASAFHEGLDSAVTATAAWELNEEKIADEVIEAGSKLRGATRGATPKKAAKGG